MARKPPARDKFSPEALEFGRKLQRELIRKQWNQSDLARAAKKFVPDIERYNVSHWVRGQHIPTPVNLDAIARALGIDPSVLMPQAPIHNGSGAPSPSPLRTEVLPGGQRINVDLHRTMSIEAWYKIEDILRQEDR